MNKINLGFWRINKWRARSRIKMVPIVLVEGATRAPTQTQTTDRTTRATTAKRRNVICTTRTCTRTGCATTTSGHLQIPVTSCTGLYDRCSPHDLHDHTHTRGSPLVSPFYSLFHGAGTHPAFALVCFPGSDWPAKNRLPSSGYLLGTEAQVRWCVKQLARCP